MMTETHSVQTIRDYLLGQLPEPDAERLDELSITDDDCAERIRAVEHDLVDAFARGELQGAVLEQFRAKYLTNPQGREAIRFARALQSLDENSRWGGSSEAGRAPAMSVRDRWRWRERLALAAAMVMLATASVWLVLENRTLVGRVTSAERSRDELQRDRQLREAEARQRAETVPLPGGRGPSLMTVATLVLAPQLRSVNQPPTVSLTDGTGELPVQLDLEPVDYPSYDVSLIASSGGQPLWRAGRLTARTVGSRQTIDLRLPTTVLRPQAYLLRVSGIPARGAPEIVGEYRFTVVGQTVP